jgi:hypothetical protein
MGLFSRNSETEALRELVDELPKQVADWTPEQRNRFTAQSDAAALEQVNESSSRHGG